MGVDTEPSSSRSLRPTVVFFPWAAIEASVAPAGMEFRHYDPSDSDWSDDIRHILSTYERAVDQPVQSATVVAYDGVVGGPLTDEQVEAAFSFREAISFAALRRREYFSHSNYCNDHTFTCIAQAYKPGEPGATAISRRRDGRAMRFLGSEYQRVICPHHVSAGSKVSLDGPLVAALLNALADPQCDWAREAIEFYNLANTDSHEVRSHMEVVLAVAATQSILGVTEKSKAGELAQVFADTLYGAAEAQLTIGDCSRIRTGKPKSLAQAWFFDLYSDRGAVAHGRSRSVANRIWNREEHLLLAAYILPRVTLIKLAAAGHYTLTEEDRNELAGFEFLLCLNNVLGCVEDGAMTGLPARFHPRGGGASWSEALHMAERERHLRQFFREHNIKDDRPL
jgi:hypothetical protein